ncbi:MAG TPA: methyl-accepting chemotaxis protein [Anaeromyxobacter sp.]|nr:methyl-accepting chemotaxis protein [Anaeromyxobacter sp.]
MSFAAALHRQLTRVELATAAVGVTYAVYFSSVANQMARAKIVVTAVATLVVTSVSLLVMSRTTRRRLDAIDRAMAEGEDGRRRAKARLLSLPWFVLWSAVWRWLAGFAALTVLWSLRTHLTGPQLAAIGAGVVIVVPYSCIQVYLATDNVVAAFANGSALASVPVDRGAVPALGSGARQLWTVAAVALMPSTVLAFLLWRVSQGAQLAHLGLHLAAIAALTALAVGGTLHESRKGERRSVAALVRGMEAVTAGDVSVPLVPISSTTEVGYLAQNLNQLVATVRRLLADLGAMSRAQEAGDVDAALDAEAFPGSYRELARQLNELVAKRVALTRKAIGVVAAFAQGDFDADLPPLPGKERFVNESLDQVRENLRGLVEAVDRMSRAHAAGEVDAAIDVERFPGGFRAIATGVNGMAADNLALSRKAMACVAEFGRGNFEAPLERFPGKKATVNETVEQVRARLRALVADARMLSEAAVAGRLDVRADAGRHAGDWRRIVEGVNATLDAVVAPTREVAEVLGRLAAGDLSARTDPARFQHDARVILEGVNGTLDALLAPMNEAGRVLARLAERDLRARMIGTYRGEHARLREAVNATAVALHAALEQVSRAAAQVSSAASQIAATSQAVAGGTSEQAAALAETNATVGEVAGTTRQTADSAERARRLADQARASAGKGAVGVEEMQRTMAGIRRSAEGTSQIIRDINDIAFQTNLLALNAAVEAARAGDAGRGFAVVAEEVRSLAQRSKEAAQRTERLIQQAVHEAGEGEARATNLAGQLAEIVEAVTGATALVGEIAGAARSQAGAVEQVSRAVGELDRSVQQNAASAEESSSAAAELKAQADALAALVAEFRIEADGAPPSRRARGPDLLPGGQPGARGRV